MPKEDTQFKSGKDWKGNPGGRPKGESLKTFARRYLMTLSDDDKKKFLDALDPQITWRMAEGNPANEMNVDGEIRLPLYLPSELLEKHELTQLPISNSEGQA